MKAKIPQNKKMKFVFALFILWSSLVSFAAPFPVTSSSVLTDPAFGLFYRGHGFSLKTSGSEWILTPDDQLSSQASYNYKPKANSFSQQARLSLKIDQISSKQNLDVYAKKWMKEYSQFGFEILGTKSLKMGGGNALLVDLFQKSKDQQVRQLIFHKGNKIVVMTCSDERTHFKKTLPQCNQLMSSFNWL